MNMKNTLTKLAFLLALVNFWIPTEGFTQATTATTTLSTAIPAASFTTGGPQWCVASATGIVLPSTTVSGTYLYTGGEAVQVIAAGSSSTCFVVKRGQLGTSSQIGHANGDTVYVGQAATSSGSASAPFGGPFVVRPPIGTCVRANQYTLPLVLPVAPFGAQPGQIINCFAGVWTNVSIVPFESINGGTEPAASTATAAQTVSLIVGGVGSAQSATTGTGGAGGPITHTAGIGGAGGSSSGTGGAGGAVAILGGAGGGTVTGGAGGAATFGGGAGGNGSTAGGTGGGLNLFSGAAGTGGTGTNGAVNIRQGGAAGTAVFTTSTAGLTQVQSVGTNQTLKLNGSGSGKITLQDGTDNTKQVVVDPSGNATGIAATLAFGATSARTATFPDATITVSGARNFNCGTTTTAACTAQIPPIIHTGQFALTSASPSVATITGLSPAFTSSSSYVCSLSPTGTTAAVAAGGMAINYVSGSSFTVTGPNTVTTQANYVCIGN
jgi:hypothetical protein